MEIFLKKCDRLFNKEQGRPLNSGIKTNSHFHSQSLGFEYRSAFSIHGDELAWEHPKLSLGQIEDFSVVFYIPLDEIGQGRYISLKVPHTAESENGFWSITLTAVAKK